MPHKEQQNGGGGGAKPRSPKVPAPPRVNSTTTKNGTVVVPADSIHRDEDK